MQSMKSTYALVVGIANYQNINKLPPTVLKDARDIYDLLIDPNYCGYKKRNVKLLLDSQATLDALRKELAKLSARCKEDSTVFIYISSHGGSIEKGAYAGEYILTVDTDNTTEESVARTALSGAEFTQALRSIKARKIVVVFDCCHSGGIGHPKNLAATTIKAGLPESYYEQLQTGRGRVIMASSRSTEVSWIMPSDDNSLFTKHLLEGLKGGAPNSGNYILILDLFSYLQPKVTAEEPNQHPILKLEIEDNFPVALYLGGHGLPSYQQIPSADFVGRDKLIDDLAASKPPTRIVAILGITGIGKSSLLQQTAVKLNGTNVFWYEFKAGLLSLDDVLMRLARFIASQRKGKINLVHTIQQPHLNDADKIDLIIDELNKDQYYLLFDSIHLIEEQPALNSFFSLLKDRLQKGTVFVAGQTKPKFYTPIDVTRHTVSVVELEGLSIEETKEFFEKKGISLSAEQAESIDDAFKGLPLALELLAALIAQGVDDVELAELINDVQGQAIEYLFQEVYQRLEQAERDLLTVASLFVFPFSQRDLRDTHQALFSKGNVATLLIKLKQRFLIKQVTSEIGLIHEVIKTMCLEHASADLASLRIRFAETLLENMSDEWGSRLEAALAYCDAEAYDQAAELIGYLTEWVLPYYPEIAGALLSRIEIEKVTPEKRVWLLGSHGKLASDLRNYKEAKEYYDAMLELAEKINDKPAISLALQRLGTVYARSDLDLAEKYYLNSLALKKELDDKAGQAEIYNNLGLLYLDRKQFEEARLMLERGLELREIIDSPLSEKLSLYSNLGILYAKQEKWEEAEKFTSLAHQAAQERGSPYEIARAIYNSALHKDAQGKNDEAIRKYLEVQAIGEEYGFWQIQEFAHRALGKKYYELEDVDIAIEHFQSLVEIQQTIEDNASLAITYLDLGSFFLKKGEKNAALAHYEKVASLFEHLESEEQIELFLHNMLAFASDEDATVVTDVLKRLKNKLHASGPSYALAKVYTTLGHIYSDLLKKDRVSLACLNCAEAMFERINRISEQVELLVSIAAIHEESIRFSKAIAVLTKAISLTNNHNLTDSLPIAYFNRGNVYHKIKSWQEAEEDYRRALRIAEDNNNLFMQQNVVNNLGMLLEEVNKPDEAILLLRSAITFAQQQNDLEGEVKAWNNLGLAYERVNEEEALKSFNQSLELCREHYRRREEANVLISLGNFYLGKKQPDKAKEYYEQSLIAARLSEDIEMEEGSMLSLAYAHRDLGTFREIEEEFKSVAERASELKHYENLITFCTVAGEVVFVKRDVSESARMFQQAFYAAIILDYPYIIDRNSDIDLFPFPHISKVIARILILLDKVIQTRAFEEAQTFYNDLVDRLNNDEEWGTIGSTIVRYYLKPIGNYLAERPSQNITDYVFEAMKHTE
jgi:tetratricopeptide (TPR) repeat protein